MKAEGGRKGFKKMKDKGGRMKDEKRVNSLLNY